MDRQEEYERAWNAAIDAVDEVTSKWSTRETWLDPLRTPSKAFDKWYNAILDDEAETRNGT